MSTRCHVIAKKNGGKSYSYRHYDGYPDGAGKDIKNFIEEHKDSIERWSENDFGAKLCDYDGFFTSDSGIHGDEDYVYIVDLDEKTVTCYKARQGNDADEGDNMDSVYEEGF